MTKNRRVSVWYVDVIDEIKIDEDGVVAFMDKYLDVMFTPSGDVIVDDRDELDAAFHSGELVVISDWRYGSKECEKSNEVLRNNWKIIGKRIVEAVHSEGKRYIG